MSQGVPSFYPKTEPADKPIGTKCRFVGTHNDNRERHGQPCTIYQHNGVGGYPYAVQFEDGRLMNAVNRELEPIEAGPDGAHACPRCGKGCVCAEYYDVPIEERRPESGCVCDCSSTPIEDGAA